jgi:hypothetical protein
MIFTCPYCNTELDRDMRLSLNKAFVSKKGYKTFCDSKNKSGYAKPKKPKAIMITKQQWSKVKKGTVFITPRGVKRINLSKSGFVSFAKITGFKKCNRYVATYTYHDLCYKYKIHKL